MPGGVVKPSKPLPDSVPSPILPDLRKALVEDLYRSQRSGVAAIPLLFLIRAGIDNAFLKVPALDWIFAGVIGLLVLRQLWAYLAQRLSPRLSTRVLHVSFWMGAALTASAHVAMHLLAYPYLTTFQVAMICVCHAGLTAGALVTMAASLPSYMAYLWLDVGSLATIVYLGPHHELRLLFLAMILLFLVAMTAVALHAHRSLRQTIALRFEAERNLRALRETQAQLLQAGKMAAIGTLVAGLSHELNNPIGIILGYAQTLLKEAPERGPSQAPLRAIERQAIRCGQLVKALLDFSRGRTHSRKTTQVDALLASVVALTQSEARRRKVDLKLEPGAGDRMVFVCTQHIESAVLNLVTNALDATPPGGVVELRSVPVVREAKLGVEIAVRDTGSGIPPDILPQIFDPFFTTKPVGQGTGLGLSLARQHVEADGGTIDVESTPGHGTILRVWLPLHNIEEWGAVGGSSNGVRE